jgi:hypothetical protein
MMLKKSSEGYIVLITVLILGTVVSTIAVYLLLSGAGSSITSVAVDASVEAKAASTGCAELALSAIQSNPTITTPSNGSSTLNTTYQETCTYAISGSTPNYTILAVGKVDSSTKNYTHNETVTTSQTAPTITISSWKDTP